MEHDDTTSEAGIYAGLNLADPFDTITAAERWRAAAAQAGGNCSAADRVPLWMKDQARAEERQQRITNLTARAHEAHAATATSRCIALLLDEHAPEMSAPAVPATLRQRAVDEIWTNSTTHAPPGQAAFIAWAQHLRWQQPAEISAQRMAEINDAYARLEAEADASLRAANALRSERSDVEQVLAVDWQARARDLEAEQPALCEQAACGPSHAALRDKASAELRAVRSLLAQLERRS